MAIRTHTNPRIADLQPEMRDLLMRNGMQAHIVPAGEGYQLVVQGHDSPLLRYPISKQQFSALTDWGTNHADKKAYNTFTEIVKDDFDLPRNFVHARNANGRVAMGLHGYRIGIGEYGRVGRYGMPPPFLGWTPRQQEGYHLRRVGGRLFYAGTPMVAERPDGRMKPGELQSGGYGFYYKGHPQPPAQPVRQDVLQELQAVITPMVGKPRSEEPAKPYKELITSPVYFSNEKWQECLSSHGILVDKEEKTLTIQSEQIHADMVYDITDAELSALTSNSIEEHSIERRLELLNTVIQEDFADKITMDSMNRTERIGITLHSEVEQDLAARQQQEHEILLPLEADNGLTLLSNEQTILQEDESIIREPQEGALIDGRDLPYLHESKGWYREGEHGREVEVEAIAVQPAEAEDKYRITAIINGEAITHEISQKQYDKFLAVDDYHRMKLFSKVFNEVDMKTRPEMRSNLGAKIFAALAAGTVVVSDLAHGIHHHPCPELYGEHFCHAPRPYFKPGVDSPRDVAARNFEAQMNQEIAEIRRGF
ncbi:hypothetical protein [Bacteroides muris (ex Afrizal et al. 2022)]|uniref:Uncharacterized protein n=2 Tax=Bacteroidales TaxID=171549 RepID=A0A4S2AYT9_9BACE|nr:hypothetical protein [Bacteroides muris (ex Afrizal et al. 2022)]TGY06252.1 hypothetical protein E5355_09610 [Bacteroides muris (ex Afrizal et al. 2022)]